MFAVRAGPDAGDDFWYSEFPGIATSSGARVSPDTALRLTAVYACVKVIAESVMQLPLILYRRLPNDEGKERATDHPMYSLLKDQPNEEQTAAEWREVMQYHLCLRGNGYADTVRDQLGTVREIRPPIHPGWVRPENTTAGRYRYVITPPDAPAYTRLPGELLHLRAMVVGNDRRGLNPIQVEREALGVGMSAQDFAARFFANDAQPGGWISHPNHFAKDTDDRERFAKSWKAAQAGKAHGSTAILEYGMEYHPIAMRLRDAEFLATRKYGNIDIARIFRVPPHLIMELDRATFSNISSQGIEFVKYTLMPWFVRWEQRLNAQFILPGSDLFFEFLVDGLERGDPEMRAAFYTSGVQNNWLMRNEIRRRENLNTKEGLDDPVATAQTPGGGPPEGNQQTAAILHNAASKLVAVWSNKMRAMEADEQTEFLRADAARVIEFMACTPEQAAWHCEFAAAELLDSETEAEWSARQVDRLVRVSQGN